MERLPNTPNDDQQIPEGYMTREQLSASLELPTGYAEFLTRVAADAANRFNEELHKAVPDVNTPPPIYKYVQDNSDGKPKLFFDTLRLGELSGQIHEDMKRGDDTA